MESFSKIISIIIIVILMFLFPMLYLAQKQDSICRNYVLTETTWFIDSVKNSGSLTANMYTEFIRKLDATGNIYDIKITHARQVINPIYDDSDVFMEDFSQNYYKVFEEDILKEIYENSGEYKLSQGDYITIKIVNRNKTYGTKLLQMILGNELQTEQIIVTYGGEVRDENY